MKKLLIIPLLLCIGCAPAFFGGKMNKEMFTYPNETCAFVDGWAFRTDVYRITPIGEPKKLRSTPSDVNMPDELKREFTPRICVCMTEPPAKFEPIGLDDSGMIVNVQHVKIFRQENEQKCTRRSGE